MEITVALRIIGTDFNPDDITAMLSCSPSFATRRGDKRFSKRTVQNISQKSIWLFEYKDTTSNNLSEIIFLLFAQLNQDEDIWRTLTSLYTVDVFCGIFLDKFNDGIEITPACLQMLSSRNITLSFDVYGDEATQGEQYREESLRELVDVHLSLQKVLMAAEELLEQANWELEIEDEVVTIPRDTILLVRSRAFVLADKDNVFLNDHYEAVVEIGQEDIGGRNRAKYGVLRLYFTEQGTFILEDRYSRYR